MGSDLFRTFNFDLGDFLQSDEAEMLGGDILHQQMNPPPAVVGNIAALVRRTLQPLRLAFGLPLVVREGYRCPALNRALGYSNKSPHIEGWGADLWVSDAYLLMGALRHLAKPVFGRDEIPDNVSANHVLFALAASNLDVFNIDELVHVEGYLGHPAWVHISGGKSRNRGRVTALKGGKKVELVAAEAAFYGLPS